MKKKEKKRKRKRDKSPTSHALERQQGIKRRRRREGEEEAEDRMKKGTDEGKMLWLNKPQDNLDGKGRYRKKNGVQSGAFGRERETGFKHMQEAQFSQLVR